jgi:hypothetical protein
MAGGGPCPSTWVRMLQPSGCFNLHVTQQIFTINSEASQQLWIRGRKTSTYLKEKP